MNDSQREDSKAQIQAMLETMTGKCLLGLTVSLVEALYQWMVIKESTYDKVRVHVISNQKNEDAIRKTWMVLMPHKSEVNPFGQIDHMLCDATIHLALSMILVHRVTCPKENKQKKESLL